MPVNHHSKFFAALLAGALLAIGACKDKGQGQGGDDSPSAKGQFAYLPKDSNVVVGVYPQQIATSGMFKELLEPQLAKSSEFQQLKEKCGFDPLATVSGVVVGGNAETQDGMVLVVKGVTKEQFVKCVPALASEGDTPPKLTEEGNLVHVEASGDSTWFGWADDKTAITRSDVKDKAGIEALLKTTDGLDKNEAMMKLIGQVDSKAAVWFAVLNTKPDQPIAGVPVQAKAIYGSMNFTQGLAFKLTLQQGSPEEAQTTVTGMSGQLEAVKQMMPYLANLTMKAEGSDVHVSLSMTNEEVKQLAPMIQDQIGGMIPGAGMIGDPGAGDMDEEAPAADDPAAGEGEAEGE